MEPLLLLFFLLSFFDTHTRCYAGDSTPNVSCFDILEPIEVSTWEGLISIFCFQEKVDRGIFTPTGDKIEEIYDIGLTSHNFSISWDPDCDRKSQAMSAGLYRCHDLLQMLWDKCEY